MAFESLTDGKIQELLRMQKRVINPAARNVADANHEKRDYIVESADGTERFRLFVRQNKTINEDFSCGLQWLPPGGESLILVHLQRLKPRASEQIGPNQNQLCLSHSQGDRAIHPSGFEGGRFCDGVNHIPNVQRCFALPCR